MNARKRLIEKVRDTVVPTLEKLGFSPVSTSDPRNAEIRTAYPFGDHHRPKGDDLQCVSLNFGKPRHLGFYLEVGIIPPDGVAVAGSQNQRIPQTNCTATWGTPAYRITPKFYHVSAKMFKVSARPSEDELDRIANLALFRLNEGVTWFDTGRVGLHMRKVNG